MSYINSTDVQTYLNRTLKTQGLNQVNAIIPAVEEFLEKACNRTWGSTGETTEVFDGGGTRLFPKHTPIASVSSLTVDDQPLVEREDFFVYDGFISMGYPTTKGHRNVSLTYTPAESLPADVKHAMVRWAAQIYLEAKDGGKVITRLQQGPMTLEYSAKDGIPQFVQEVIGRHRLFAR
jgi:hypothetical protein